MTKLLPLAAKLFITTVVMFYVGTVIVESGPSVDIISPVNDTNFNRSVSLIIESNESINESWYSLDGGALVNFTFNGSATSVNISVEMGRGPHNFNVTLYNGTFNSSNTTFFTTNFISLEVFDLETENNISSGISIRLLSFGESVLIDNTTNASGAGIFTGQAEGIFKLQAGGPAGSAYPHIFTIPINFSTSQNNFAMFLPETTACSFRTYQYVDNFFQTPLDLVRVVFHKADKILTVSNSSVNGFVTQCLVPGLGYVLESSKATYVKTNFTDRATIPSQLVQMVRISANLVPEASITLITYPFEEDHLLNDTLQIAMEIRDTENDLVEYGIVYGRTKAIIEDDNIDSADPLFKLTVATGSAAGGSYIECTDNCLDLRKWGEPSVFVGYFYRKNSQSDRVWNVREFDIVEDRPVDFWTNYSSTHNPRDAIHRVFASFGYAGTIRGPSLGMITFSLLVMMMSAAGAARNGWGLMGAALALFGANVILVLLSLIQWWSLLFTGLAIGFLSKRFGGTYS